MISPSLSSSAKLVPNPVNTAGFAALIVTEPVKTLSESNTKSAVNISLFVFLGVCAIDLTLSKL